MLDKLKPDYGTSFQVECFNRTLTKAIITAIKEWKVLETEVLQILENF